MFGKKSENEEGKVETGEKKPEAVEKEEVIKGAEKHAEESKKHVDHQHVLMGPKFKMNLLEISHRDIEEIEKARFRIMAKHDGEKAVEEFKNFVFEKLLVK